MDLKDIKAIIDLMKKNSITEFELEEKDSKLRLKRGLNGGAPAPPAGDDSSSQLPMPVQMAAPMVGGTPAAPAPNTGEIDIKSPMIGTFYRSPSPEAGPYLDVGSEVGPETVACIIEAMKVMNEIKAETRGVIVEVLAQNGKPVEFGKPLFAVRPV